MASDLSNIIKGELATTLEQLLAKKTSIESTLKTDINAFEEIQAIEVGVKFEFKNLTSIWKFIIPTITAAKFEYLMLGGMGDLKDYIDDETTDAVSEIISNISGSITTSINAQGYEDLGSVKIESLGNQIVNDEQIKENDNLYTFTIAMEEDSLPVFVSFDKFILPFIYDISGVEEEVSPPKIQTPTNQVSILNDSNLSLNDDLSSLISLLGEDSISNLKLLFDIKLKLSVRLGSKNFLLKDILRWDIGEIIELEQMVNEPLEILVNGIKVGEGEAVIVEGKFGLKIKKIGSEQSRLAQISLGR